MRKILFLYLLAFIVVNAWSKPLPVKTKHTIIIDTDCAIDDLRAISFLLSRPEISVLAILVSDGSLPPSESIKKIGALLNEFKCDTIPVGVGKTIESINPSWRSFNSKIIWGKEPDKPVLTSDAVTMINDLLKKSNEKITIVCLGSLTNISETIKKYTPDVSKIERIVWYNDSVKPVTGFNYECDRQSADFILNSGVRVDNISNLKKEGILIDTSFYSLCKISSTVSSKVILNVLKQPPVYDRLLDGHFNLTDDLVSIYLTNPELFDMNINPDNVKIRYNKDYNIIAVKEAISDMIKGIYVPGGGVVFNNFPYKREMYTYDVRQIMDSAISLYGTEEWKANVMTDEFHGHLGVYSIVGAKMGIRARELFNVGPDEIEVISYAGSKPPYSCLNDGIQVSTGATLGMGTIFLANDSIKKPEAIFKYNNRSIKISLKPEYLAQVEDDINEGILKFGLLDDGYWKLIRLNALNYWLNWSRNEIFEITELGK